MLRFLGTTIRVVVILVVVVALLSLPLFTIHRSKCIEEDAELGTRWSFVLPWDDPENGDCGDHQNGFEVLRDEVGLD